MFQTNEPEALLRYRDYALIAGLDLEGHNDKQVGLLKNTDRGGSAATATSWHQLKHVQQKFND